MRPALSMKITTGRLLGFKHLNAVLRGNYMPNNYLRTALGGDALCNGTDVECNAGEILPAVRWRIDHHHGER